MSALRAVPVRYRILAVLFVLSFVNYFLRNNLSVVVPSLRQEFGFSSAELGWILAVSTSHMRSSRFRVGCSGSGADRGARSRSSR